MLWLEHDTAPDCSPAVTLKLTTSTGPRTFPLLDDKPVDLTVDINVDPDWHTRFQVEITRLDTDPCPLSVVWSDAGTR